MTLFNRVKFNATGGGTGAFAVSTALADFQTPAGAGVADQTKVSYTAWLSGSAWECGLGTYSVSGTLVSRDLVLASNSGGVGSAPISFGSAPTVWLDVVSSDYAGGLSSTYIGPVATHARTCDGVSATGSAQTYNSRTYHIARDDISVVKVGWAGWYLNATGTETNSTGTGATVTASIEYPAGTFTQLKFGGSTSGTLNAGADFYSDFLAVTIPRGAAFWVRSFQSWSNGGTPSSAIIATGGFGGPVDYGNGEALDASAVDHTMSGTITDAGFGSIIPPMAIVGPTTRPTALLLLDSRVVGYTDGNNGSNITNATTSLDTSGDFGYFARAIGSEFAYINASRSAAKCVDMTTSNAHRVALGKWCSHILCNGGGNDLAASASAATVQGYLATIAALFPGKPFWQSTIEPVTTSSNGWSDVAGQTVSAWNGARITLNTTIRALGITGQSGCIEIADRLESSRNSGFWAGGFLTNDGDHASTATNIYLRDIKAIDPLKIFKFPANTQTAIDEVVSHVAPLSFRNVLRGDGGFEVWQRGAGAAASIAVPASTTAYTADKWYLKTGATQASVVSASTGLVPGSNLAAQVQRNSGQTGTGVMYFARPLDTYDIVPLRGKLIAVSFTVVGSTNWSPTNGLLNFNVYFGTGAVAKRNSSALTNEVNPVTAAINLAAFATANYGQRVTLVSTVPVPSNATQGEIQFSWTPVGTAGTLDAFAVDDVQLEVALLENPVATPFERLPFVECLALCEEWYEKTFPYATAPAQSGGTAGALNIMTPIASARPQLYWSYKVKKRPGSTVSVTTYNPSAANANWRDITGTADVAVTLDPSTIGGENGVLIGSSATITTIGSSAAIHATADCSI